MGRSGTSALTRVLSLCGAALPLKTLPADVANPRGYWEPQGALDLNIAFLSRHHSSWYDDDLELEIDEEPNGFIDEIASFLAVGFEPEGPLVIKEPRVSALLPFWLEAAARAGLRSTIVHSFRRPDDVASSLRVRDGLSTAQSYALWMKYNLIAERGGRGLPRVFVAFEDLMSDWRPLVARCAEKLSLPLRVDAAAAAAIDEFLESGLRHHASEGLPLDAGGAGLLLTTYALLNRAKHGGVDGRAFDALLAEYAESRALDRQRNEA
jgi:hypothetical protein